MANEERWLAMLEAEDVDGFNGRRTDRTRIELFASDLSGKALVGIDLSNANLEKSDLTGANLTEANLVKANFAGIDASGAILRDVLGARARFKEAWLDGADLTGADFVQADFADANLERTEGQGVRFGGARLRGVKAAGAKWRGANLAEAKLEQAVFKGADLTGADLSDVHGNGVDLTDASLDGVVATNARLAGAKLAGAKLGAARLAGANLAGADLSRSDLAAADLSRANLTNAILTGAVLRGAVLADANLEGVRLEGVDLAEADLSGLDPAALGLDAQVTETLSTFGVVADAEAELVLADVVVARSGGAVAVVWENPEGEAPPPSEDGESTGEPRVLRYAVFSAAGAVCGVFPVPGDAVLDRQIVAWGDGFRVVVTRSRSDGPALVIASLSAEGALGQAKTVPLGYDPSVRGVLRREGNRLLLYGLARRGPTVVVHDLSEAELKLVSSQALPTATAFLPGHTVMACKGGVIVAVSASGVQPPRRCPDGFPGHHACALPLGADLLTVRAVPRQGRIAGGIRYAVIGRRHAPREEALGAPAEVTALAAVPQGEERVRLWWVSGEAALWTCLLPGGEPEPVLAADITELAIAEDVVAVLGPDGAISALDPAAGTEIARWDPRAGASEGSKPE